MNEYEFGYVDGLFAYAHMKDGVFYVGTTGSSLKKAAVEFLTRGGTGRTITEAEALVATYLGVRLP